MFCQNNYARPAAFQMWCLSGILWYLCWNLTGQEHYLVWRSLLTIRSGIRVGVCGCIVNEHRLWTLLFFVEV